MTLFSRQYQQNQDSGTTKYPERTDVNGAASAPPYAVDVVGGVETFNAANSYDFELPDHYLEDLVLEIAQLIGVNLRDQFVTSAQERTD